MKFRYLITDSRLLFLLFMVSLVLITFKVRVSCWSDGQEGLPVRGRDKATAAPAKVSWIASIVNVLCIVVSSTAFIISTNPTHTVRRGGDLVGFLLKFHDVKCFRWKINYFSEKFFMLMGKR